MNKTERASAFKMDLILISDARDEKLRQITEVAIISAGPHVNIIVVESNREIYYDNVITIHPTIPFNYNAYLNVGARAGSSEYILFGNNDLIFMPGWSENIISEMEKYGVVSASPLSPISNAEDTFIIGSGSVFGYDMMTKFCGWAFVWKRDFFDKVQGLDEDFAFWCADNSAVEQLKKHHEKHILVTSSLVQHMGSTTLKHLDSNLRYQYTVLGVEKFNTKFQVNLWEEAYLKKGRAKFQAPESTLKRLVRRVRNSLN
jgi:hypothetical protein